MGITLEPDQHYQRIERKFEAVRFVEQLQGLILMAGYAASLPAELFSDYHKDQFFNHPVTFILHATNDQLEVIWTDMKARQLV